MVHSLQRPALPNIPRRFKLTKNPEELNLEDLVTERTVLILDVLMEKDKEKSQSVDTGHLTSFLIPVLVPKKITKS